MPETSPSPPVPRIFPTASSTRCGVRPLTTTEAPSRYSPAAAAKPIPAVEPVTNARLPRSCRSMSASPILVVLNILINSTTHQYIICIINRRTFYIPEASAPVFHARFVSLMRPSPFFARRPTRIGASGPRLQASSRLSTTSNRAAAPPAGGKPLAKGSTTAIGKSTVVHPAQSGTASG